MNDQKKGLTEGRIFEAAYNTASGRTKPVDAPQFYEFTIDSLIAFARELESALSVSPLPNTEEKP
jgi:hypothetical protein